MDNEWAQGEAISKAERAQQIEKFQIAYDTMLHELQQKFPPEEALGLLGALATTAIVSFKRRKRDVVAKTFYKHIRIALKAVTNERQRNGRRKSKHGRSARKR